MNDVVVSGNWGGLIDRRCFRPPRGVQYPSKGDLDMAPEAFVTSIYDKPYNDSGFKHTEYTETLDGEG